MKSLAIIAFTLAVLPRISFADDPEIPLLERTVSLQVKNASIESILKEISAQANLTFSYNPAVVNAEKRIDFNASRLTVREALDKLFNGTVQYKQRNQYIILTRAAITAQKERMLGGYITNEETGEKLKNVSIYDPVSLSSAITDDYGYFEIKVQDALANVTLVVNKQNYADTLLVVARENAQLLKIPIRQRAEKISTLADSLGRKVKRLWKKSVSSIQSINMINITDTLHRQMQFSVLPFVGTNHKLSGNVINNYSLNLLGGYSLGVDKLELGGLFNSVRGDVHGFQAAGWFNAVGKDITGVQLAGLFNATAGKSKAAQFAGLINFNWGESESINFAGLVNYNQKDSRSLKFAGIVNSSIGKLDGFQTAGLTNFAMRDTRGGQLSGLLNAAADTLHGVQIAGLVNVGVKLIHGAQVSGLVNLARNVQGAQIGLINIADSVKGVQFGLLSFAWKGYHTFEFSSDEIFYTNLAFRTGTRAFYNIFAVDAKPDTFHEDEATWSFGYGIGTLPRLTKKLYLNVDLTSNQIVKGKIDAVNILNKLYVGFDYRLAKKLSLTAGATLNAYVTDSSYEFYPALFSDYKPSIFHTSSGSNQWQWWWGAKIGVRLL